MAQDGEPARMTAETMAAGAPAFLERGTREFRLAALALFAAGFSTFALIYCVQPIMPVFSDEFHVRPAEASLSLSLTTQCLAFAMLVASGLSEAWGRKPVMVASLFASAMLTMALAAVPDWRALLLLRALAGLTFSGLPAVAMAYVGEEVEPRSLGMAMGLYIGGTGLGALGGRLIVGVLTDVAGWRVAMFVVGALALASGVVFTAVLPPSRRFVPRPLAPSSLLRAFATHLTHPVLLLLYAEGGLLLGVFVALYNYVGYRLMAPPYGFGQTAVGLIFLLSLVGIVSAAWVGDLAVRLGRARVFLSLVMLVAAGVALTLDEALWAILAGLGLATLAFYGAHSIASAWVGSEARVAKAQAASLYLFAYYSGSSLFGSLGGLAWQQGGWNGVAAMCGGLLVLCLLGGFLLIRRGSDT